MDSFITEFNNIVENVDPETLDLIVFPQFSTELDHLEIKNDLLSRCVEMSKATKSA